LKTTRTVLAVALAAAFGCAHAQSIQTLDPVVVTASKVEEPQGQATVLVEVVDRAAIEQSGAANVTELLDQVSGGILTRQYGRLGVDAAFDLGYLGGASAQRTLILIDGVRMNDIDDSTVRWGQLPLDAIEQVEIRKAGGGVLFGDRALGGVVNIITKRKDAAGSAHLTFGSFGTRIFGLNKSTLANGTSFNVSAQQAETNGYRHGAEQRLKSAHFGVEHTTPIGRIGVTHRASNEDVYQPNSISLASFQADSRFRDYLTRSERRGNNTDLLWSSTPQRPSVWSARFSKENSKNETTWTRYETERNTLDLQLTQNLNGGRLITGLEHFDANSKSSRQNRLRVDQLSSAAYASIDHAIGTSLFNFGARAQRMNNSFLGSASSPSQESKENLRSWSLGGLTPLGKSTFRYSLHSSFSFPTADQLYTYTTSFVPVDIFSGVKAMESREGQAVLSGKFADLYFEAGGRYIEVAGEIGQLLNCVGANSCNTNLYDTSRVIGFIKLRGGASNALSWTASIDRIQSEIESGTDSGKRVPMVPNLVARGALHLKQVDGRFSLIGNYRGDMIQSSDTANVKFRIPARLTVDVGYLRRLDSDRRELSLWIRNLADRQYFDFAAWDGFGSGVAPADGRSIELRIKQDF
jgi:iron complex outermembrane receptor protein